LLLRRIEDELRFAALLRDGVIAIDHELGEGLVIGGEAVAEDQIVEGVGESRNGEDRQKADQDYSLEEMLDAGASS
jgi:hypothetical protein